MGAIEIALEGWCKDIWGLPNSLQTSPRGNLSVPENALVSMVISTNTRRALVGSRTAAVSSALGHSRLGRLRSSSTKGAYRGFGLVATAMATLTATTQQPWH